MTVYFPYFYPVHVSKLLCHSNKLGNSTSLGLASPRLNVDLPFAGYFIRIPFPRHEHVYHERYKHHENVDACACNWYQTTFPLLCGLCTRLRTGDDFRRRERVQQANRVQRCCCLVAVISLREGISPCLICLELAMEPDSRWQAKTMF